MRPSAGFPIKQLNGVHSARTEHVRGAAGSAAPVSWQMKNDISALHPGGIFALDFIWTGFQEEPMETTFSSEGLG